MRAKKTVITFALAVLAFWTVFFLWDSKIEHRETTNRYFELSAEQLVDVRRLVVVWPDVYYVQDEDETNAAADGDASSPSDWHTVPALHERYGRDTLHISYGESIFAENYGMLSDHMKKAYLAGEVLEEGVRVLEDGEALIAFDSVHPMQEVQDAPEPSPAFSVRVDGDTLYIHFPNVKEFDQYPEINRLYLPKQISQIETNLRDLNIETEDKYRDPTDTVMPLLNIRAPKAHLYGHFEVVQFQSCGQKQDTPRDNPARVASKAPPKELGTGLYVKSSTLKKLDARLGAFMSLDLYTDNLEAGKVRMDEDYKLTMVPMASVRQVEWHDLTEQDIAASAESCITP